MKENNKIVESLVDVSTHCDIFMKSKKMVCLIVVMLVVLIFGSSVQATDRQKGDINGDDKISITDISQLKLHLVGMKEIATEYQTYADINGDNKLSVTDLSKLKMQMVGLGNKTLTDEELNVIREMIGRDFYNIDSFTPETLKYDQIVYLTYNAILHGQEQQSYDEDLVINLHFGDKGPAGGDVYVCPVNDTIKMYKLLFNIDITREEVINKMGSSYHEEIDAATFQFEGGGNGLSFSISDAYYNNGQYFVNITWYDDSTINPETDEPYGYNYTGLLILKKVEDKFFYSSYTTNTGRSLNETEKSEIDSYLNQNHDFLSRSSFIYFGGLELWNQHAFKQMIFLSPRTNEYSVEDLKNMYIQVSGLKQLDDDKTVYETTFESLKNLYKEKFNIDLTKDYMNQMIEKSNQYYNIYEPQYKMHYIEEKDLILMRPESSMEVYGKKENLRVVEGFVENNVYTIILEYNVEGEAEKLNLTLNLNKIGDKYYINTIN